MWPPDSVAGVAETCTTRDSNHLRRVAVERCIDEARKVDLSQGGHEQVPRSLARLRKRIA